MCFILDSAAIPLFPSSPSVFKPDELRQALMPTLEALYRQDPESLPFRQPVDPQLLGIPVRIRTSNKTNLVRACAGTHYATKNLALFSSSLIVIIILPLPPLFLSSACCCVHCVWMWERHRKLASVAFLSENMSEYKAAQTMNICSCVFILSKHRQKIVRSYSNQFVIVLKLKHLINELSHFFWPAQKHNFDSVWDVFGQQLFFIYLFFKLVMLLMPEITHLSFKFVLFKVCI